MRLRIPHIDLVTGQIPDLLVVVQPKAKRLGPKSYRKDDGNHIESPTGNVLFVESGGRPDAPILVFIHGLNSSSEQWKFQQQHFSAKYRLILIDLPGHGRSPDAQDLPVRALASDLGTVLSKLDILHPVLYGHSLGGMVILEYCKEKISPSPRAIILQSCSHTNPLKTMPTGPLPWLLQRPMIAPALENIARANKLFTVLGFAAYSLGLSAVFYRMVLFTGKQSGATLRSMAVFAAKTKAKTIARALLGTFGFNVTRSLKKIEHPCLIIAAKNDRLIHPGTAVYMHQQINGSQLAMLNGGHQTLAEFPEETNDAIEEFLGRQRI